MHELAIAESLVSTVLERTGGRVRVVRRWSTGCRASCRTPWRSASRSRPRALPWRAPRSRSTRLAPRPPDVGLRRPGRRGTWRESAARARAHHSFQVFEVYPWAAMLLRGLPSGPAVSVLDRCRNRSGVVSQVGGEWVVVSGPASCLGTASPSARRRPGEPNARGGGWTPRACCRDAVGDTVSLHWDWVCEVLTPDQAERLVRLESNQRAAVGLSPARVSVSLVPSPGPRSVDGRIALLRHDDRLDRRGRRSRGHPWLASAARGAMCRILASMVGRGRTAVMRYSSPAMPASTPTAVSSPASRPLIGCPSLAREVVMFRSTPFETDKQRPTPK